MLEQRYRLPPNVLTKKKGTRYLFLNPIKPSWIVTNSNGAKALSLCNGRRTLKEIINIISKDACRDVSGEINNFFQEIACQVDFFSPTNIDINRHHTNNLHIIHLNLTEQCNLRCIYCYACERSNSHNTLSYRDYLNIIDSIGNINKKGAKIILTGGEPLLSGHAFDIAEYAKKKGNKVQLLSNGLLINKDNVKRIGALFDLVKISLDGSTAEINDYHRGKGSFDKIVNAIDLLLENNASLSISMTVTKKNIKEIKNMTRKYGSFVSFAPLFKAGRARNGKDLTVSGKTYYKALSKVKGANPLDCLCDSFNTALKKKIMKCAIGDSEISISNTGDVYPCHLLHLPQFLAGNIKEQSLEEIYNTSDKLMSCRNLTVSQINGCNKCDIRFICGGACRARAYYEKGKIEVSDNFCEYEKLAYLNGFFELYEIN